MTKSLAGLLDDLRKCSNRPPIGGMYRSDPQRWAMLCTCMDTLGDTQSAIEAFRETRMGADKSELYLRTYGVLQAIFVQQDALDNLAKSLDVSMDIKKDPGVKSIRDVRNNIVGHPTARGPEDRQSSYRISQHTLSATRFEALELNPESDRKIIEVNIYEITMKNECLLTGFLQKILAHVHSRWINHANKFRHKSLARITPQRRVDELNQLMYNLRDGIDCQGHIVSCIDLVYESILELEIALKEREYDLNKVVQLHISCAKFAINEVRFYVAGQPSMQIDVRGTFGVWVQAYCYALRGLFLEFRNLPSVESGPLDDIQSNWNYHTQKVEEVASVEFDSACYALINVASLKDAIPKITGALDFRKSDSTTVLDVRRRVNKICEFIEIVECCIKSKTSWASGALIYTDADLFVCLFFLKENLNMIYESSLAIDDEYDLPVLSKDSGTHP